MQEFIRVIEAAAEHGGCCQSRNLHWTRDYERMEEARRHLDAAHAAAEGNETVEQRLLSWELYFESSVLQGPARLKLIGSWHNAYGYERDADILREGLERMELAAEYSDKMLEKHDDVLNRNISSITGPRPEMSRVRRLLTMPRGRFVDGARGESWRQRISELEDEESKAGE